MISIVLSPLVELKSSYRPSWKPPMRSQPSMCLPDGGGVGPGARSRVGRRRVFPEVLGAMGMSWWLVFTVNVSDRGNRRSRDCEVGLMFTCMTADAWDEVKENLSNTDCFRTGDAHDHHHLIPMSDVEFLLQATNQATIIQRDASRRCSYHFPISRTEPG